MMFGPEVMQIGHVLFRSLLEIATIVGFTYVAVKIHKEMQSDGSYLGNAIFDFEGDVSSTRVKVIWSTYIALFLIVIGTVSSVPVQWEYIALTFGFGMYEHTRESVKEVRNRKSGVSKDEQS
jgi:hypothetical protein